MALDLNYKPIALVDTSTLTEEEWLAWRKKGIGGSDVAAALHLSPYKTARDLYFDKIGVEPTVEQPDKSITFAIGHLLEDVVAQIFSKKTGFTVYRDQTMYQHPFFPFLLADVDRFLILPDGRKAILECKTAHYNMQYSADMLEKVDLSYCISIHKSQGAEFPVVIIPILKEHYIMLRRNLLYTAISRAKVKVILIGQKQAVFMAIHKSDVDKRNTILR